MIYEIRVRKSLQVVADDDDEALCKASTLLMDMRGAADFDISIESVKEDAE